VVTNGLREELQAIRSFDDLVIFLRDEMGWPIEADLLEDDDELFFEYSAAELGLDPASAANIESIKRLRPLSANQPWGIFFIEFDRRRLPIVALRRILSAVARRKRASANAAQRQAWQVGDLLFISNYGRDDERQISFAQFTQSDETGDLPTLKVLGWDNRDTGLHLDDIAEKLVTKLSWPAIDEPLDVWRDRWRSAFALRPREVITTSRQLSIRLAELARAIRDRTSTALAIEVASGPLTKLMKAFQQALVHDLDVSGFADMYAQTIAYGLLSARIADPHKRTAGDFAAHMRTNPFLRELMETFLKAGVRHSEVSEESGIDFDELGVSEVVELFDEANMEAVVRDFGDRNPQEDPVIHFYELFLREYDAKRRMQRGVFYTPRPVVSFIVRSVDELLRTEFGLVDGLADTTTWGEMAQRYQGLAIPRGVPPEQAFVQVLDPATGTGTFLVEAIDLIHKRMVTKWSQEGHGGKDIEALWNRYVPLHLLPRLHGYELLMAPYAIAHLKIGLKLHETGYRFGGDERVRIYLTNALEPASDYSDRFGFAVPALAHEAVAVDDIKRDSSFTVVLGNPPYACVSSNLTPELRRTVDPYRTVRGERIVERSMLQFEKNIQDDYVKFLALGQRLLRGHWGVLALITNHSYFDGPTLRGLRCSLLDDFPLARFVDLHGNANKGEIPPDGGVDQNVFDIRQGVAIAVLARAEHSGGSTLTDLWGPRETKYRWLVSNTSLTMPQTKIDPQPPYYYLVLPEGDGLESDWQSYLPITDVFLKRSTGTETGFDDLLIAFTESELRDKVDVFSGDASEDDLANIFSISDGHAAVLFANRRTVCRDLDQHIRRIQLRAYDYRVALLRKDLLKTNSFNVMLDLSSGAPGLVTTRQTKEAFAAFAITGFCGHKCTSSYDRSYVFPSATAASSGMLTTATPCIHRDVLSRFSQLGWSSPGDGDLLRHAVLAYSLAVLNAPSYSTTFASRLRRDWPRLPLSCNAGLVRKLVDLGAQLIAVQTMESPILDECTTIYVGPRNPTVGKVNWSDNTVWLDGSAAKKARAATPGSIGFRGVPEAVWAFRLGGYQVCEKWLKDRKGRTLSGDEIAHYQKIVVALSETIRVVGEIDDVIDAHGGWPGAFAAAT
jgi:hypothetical protein